MMQVAMNMNGWKLEGLQIILGGIFCNPCFWKHSLNFAKHLEQFNFRKQLSWNSAQAVLPDLLPLPQLWKPKEKLQ